MRENSCCLFNNNQADFVEAFNSKIVSEYDQEIPQSQTADNPMAQLQDI